MEPSSAFNIEQKIVDLLGEKICVGDLDAEIWAKLRQLTVKDFELYLKKIDETESLFGGNLEFAEWKEDFDGQVEVYVGCRDKESKKTHGICRIIKDEQIVEFATFK